MYKIFTFLAVLGCMLCANTSNAQTSFTVTPSEDQGDIMVDDTVTVHITVTDFTDIATYQFSLNWTTTELTFVSIHSLGLPNLSLGDFGPNGPSGFITTSWSAPGATEYTSPDTCIFAVDFIVENTAGITGDILITSNPTTIEVVGLDSNGDLDDITSTVTFTNGSATIPSPPNGQCDFGGEFGQSIDSADVQTGNEVCLTVYACGFDDIVSAQYSINWDPADLQFNSTTNYNLQNLDASAFNFNNAQGWMTFSWLDSLGAGLTVPDLTPIYDVCFTAIGSGGTTDTVSFTSFPSTIEVTDAASMGSPIPFNSTPGLVNISGNAPSAVTVSGSCETGGQNDEICIQMTSQNFDSIVGIQYTMHWDPSVLEYASVGNFADFLAPGDINPINDSTAIFQFNDFGLVPHSLMNGDTLYAICFNIIGGIGETGTFTIDGTPIIEEATQIVNGSDEVVPLITQTCNVEVVGVSNDLNIFASTQDGCPESPEDTVYVTYTTTGFISIASMQFDITYDDTVLEFIDKTNINPGLPGNHQFISQANGDLRYSWFEPNTNALNLMDGDTMYQLCFKVIGDDGENTTFSYDYGGVIEITDGSNLITAYTLHDGGVNVTTNACTNPIGPEASGVVTNIDCNGNATGAIDLTATSGTPGYTFLWMPGGATTEDISGLSANTYTVVVTDMAGLTTTESFTITEPTALTATTTQSEISCNGLTDGGATVSPTGGSPIYTYLWDNGETTATVTNLGLGESCVTVTDDSLCTVVACVTITQPTAVTATLTSTNSNCTSPTGTVTATPAGGSGAGYTYSWDNGAMTQSLSGVGPGNYCVTITDGDGCTAGPFCQTVGTLSGPSIPALTSTNATCAGNASGTLTAAPTDGTPPYNYLWSNGQMTATATGLVPGMHTVTVTDAAGCDAVENGTVGADDGISTTFNITDASCAGNPSGIVTAQPADGSGTYSYQWGSNTGNATSQGISGLVPDDYTVTVTDDASGCTVVETATVGAGPGSDVTTSSTDVACPGNSDGTATAIPVSGAGNYTYVWSAPGGTSATITGLPAGTYTVTMTDAAGCTDASTTTVGTPSAVVADAYVDSGYNGEDISCNGGSDGVVEASGAGGNPNYTYAWSTGHMTQQVTGLPQGTYTVTVTDENGCTDTDDVFLDDPEPISLSAVVTDEDTGSDGAINLSDSGGTGGFTYLWAPGGATSQDISGLTADEYCVTVTDGNDCEEVGCYTVNPPNALDITLIGTTPESCFGEEDGTINITSTGTSPFTYVWDPALTPSTANPTNVGQGTYSVTVTDAVGITGVESGILVGGPTEAMNITTQSTTDVSCNGGADACITIDVSGGNGGPYTVNWGAAGVGTNICGLSVGSYTPTVTDNNGCTAVGTLIAIDQPAAIVVTVDQIVMPSCGSGSDGEVHISAVGGTGAYTVAWEVDNIPVAGNTTMDLTGLDGGTVTGTVTDVNGCIETFGPITLVQEGSPTIAIDAINQPTCSDDTGSILVTVTGGVLPYTYVWTDINSVNISGQEDLLDIEAGSYILTVEDANGCIAMTDVIVITAPDAVTVSVNTIVPATSDDDDGSITMNPPSGGTAPYTYLWTDSDGMTVNTTLDLTGLPMDLYTLVVTDVNGCTTTTTALVPGSFTIPPSQVVVTDVTCAGGDDGVIDISVFGGTEPYTYFWGPPSNETTQDLANLTAGEYCVTVTDAAGLLAFGCWTVVAPDQLTIQTTDVVHETGNGCNGSIDITVDGGTIPYTYAWSNGDDNQNPVDLCKGAYFVTITDVNGCIIVSNQIDVFPPPMTIEDPIIVNEICAGDCTGSINLTVFGGCAPYDFELTDNATGAMTTATDLDGINETLGDLCPSSYSLVVVDSDESVNTPALAYSFTILEGDVIVVDLVSITNNTGGPDCNGAINITPSGGSGTYEFLWSNGETSEDVVGLCNDGSPYSVTVTDTSTGCIGTLSNLEVNDLAYVSEFEVTNVTCFGDSDGAIDLITVIYGTAPYTYEWSSGEATPDINNKPAGPFIVTITDAIGNTSVASFDISGPSQPLEATEISTTDPTGTIPNGAINIGVTGGWGDYSYSWSNGATSMDLGGLFEGCYTVTVTDGGGCENILGPICLEAIILIDDPEKTDITCYGDADGLICTMISGGGVGGYTYEWSNGETEDCIYDLEPGTYTLTVTDANGLTNEFSYEITEPDPLEMSFVTEPSTATATAIGGTGPYEFTWNTNPQTIGPTVVDQPTGTYGVVVVDSKGCMLDSLVDITEEIGGECDEVRTILSPNGDGKNDNFLILCARVSDINLEVFNRWGQLVYEATNYDNSWEGTDQSGNILPEGGYMYVITYKDSDGKEKQAKGHLTLIKSNE